MKLLFHRAPEGYEYWMEDFNSKFKRIWIQNRKFDFSFNDGIYPNSVWGFFNKKTSEYHSPINSKKPGGVVDIKETTPFSAMKINLNPLMKAFNNN